MKISRIFLMMVGIAAAVVSGCGTTVPLSPADHGSEDSIAYTMIYVIHGDGEYLFHEDGAARRADREALAKAQLVARNAPKTEVFIFHQRHDRKILGVIPRSNGRLFHYRDGSLIEERGYRRNPDGLTAEASLYQELAIADVPRAFLYYGHDIPEHPRPYHASFPRAKFSVETLTRDLAAFGAEDDPFDLIVLSSCNNGSPGTVAAVAPFTRFILASPGDLHLSYIDPHPLHRIANADGGMERLAPQLAEWAYQRLQARTRTAVALTLYDTEELMPILDTAGQQYARMRERLEASSSVLLEDFVDCADEGMSELKADLPGVRQWYRPAAFGRLSSKQSHSGWGCPIALY